MPRDMHTPTQTGNKSEIALAKAVFANRNFCLHQAYKECVQLSFNTFYIACKDLGLFIFFHSLKQ